MHWRGADTDANPTDDGTTWEEAAIDDSPEGVTEFFISSVAALPDGTLVAIGNQTIDQHRQAAAWLSVAH